MPVPFTDGLKIFMGTPHSNDAQAWVDIIPATAGLEDRDRKDYQVEQISASAHAFTALTKEFAILFSSIEVDHFCDEDRMACSEANVGLIPLDELCRFFNDYH